MNEKRTHLRKKVHGFEHVYTHTDGEEPQSLIILFGCTLLYLCVVACRLEPFKEEMLV